jgi:hypothetical protein
MVRPILPKAEQASPAYRTEPSAETKFSKRRCVSSACLPCRKRKSKVQASGERRARAFSHARSIPEAALLTYVRRSAMERRRLVQPASLSIIPSALTSSTTPIGASNRLQERRPNLRRIGVVVRPASSWRLCEAAQTLRRPKSSSS